MRESFERIVMDIVGPGAGEVTNTYILVLCDYVTRYP